MKAIWTGAIGFGLVNIPVKLYSASERSELNLDMLDKKNHTHIHYKRVNHEGKEVTWENIVKGYKYKNKYVILTDDDFKKASPKKSAAIDITDFVKEEDIESIYFENPYYLAPDKSGVKAYALLRAALEKSKKAGIGSFVLRNKEHLCVLKPSGNVIVLNTLRYAEEIRDTDELAIPKGAKPTAAELKMAMSLIDQLTAPFNLKKFKDTYSAELLKLIHKKAKTKGKATEEEEEPKLKVTHRKAEDLMAQLKASLKKAS